MNNENTNQYDKAPKLNDLININVKNFISKWAKENNVILCKPCIVANVDGNYVKVYFPTDMTNMSTPYKNKTNTTLTVGQKVYLFHLYGDISQGWIIV